MRSPTDKKWTTGMYWMAGKNWKAGMCLPGKGCLFDTSSGAGIGHCSDAGMDSAWDEVVVRCWKSVAALEVVVVPSAFRIDQTSEDRSSAEILSSKGWVTE